MERLIDTILAFKQRCRLEAEMIARLPLTAREASLVCALAGNTVYRAHDLATRVGLSPSRLSRLLGGLQKKNMIAWNTSSQDRRALDIALTKKGRDLCARLEKAKEECEKRLRARLTKEEAATVEKGIKILTQAL
jgi:DNA-binding MarR family transcriptional regulator